MNLQERLDLLVKLSSYLNTDTTEWAAIKETAEQQNAWFTQTFINTAVTNITTHFLDSSKLEAFVAAYHVPAFQPIAKNIGVVMAGNIPLVGFHDWLCIFLSGHRAIVKPSTKDKVLITHIVEKLSQWNEEVKDFTRFSDMLKNCDAYIATGSNNSARYFSYYFSKYRHIIRRNRTSVAILTGQESTAELDMLSDDINLYYGLGCRNVTKLYVPAGYDFIPLLASFNKYLGFAEHNKYKNNYDYQLAILLLNNKYYMTNGSVLLVENEAIFSAISELHYEYYITTAANIADALRTNPDIQCTVGKNLINFGEAQTPALNSYADGIDTMAFLLDL